MVLILHNGTVVDREVHRRSHVRVFEFVGQHQQDTQRVVRQRGNFEIRCRERHGSHDVLGVCVMRQPTATCALKRAVKAGVSHGVLARLYIDAGT